MTEMSPVGTVASLKGSQKSTCRGEAQFALQAKQGRAVFGVDMKIVDGQGREDCPGTARSRAS